MNTIFRWRPVVSIATLTLLASCSQPSSTREKGALVGGGLGAATSAIIGSATSNPGAGAAIGGALGAAGGGVVGDQLQRQEGIAKEQQRILEQQQQELARNRQLLAELKRKNLEARETERGVVVNLPDVLFAFGKANLTSNAVGKVRNIAEVLTTQAKGRHIVVRDILTQSAARRLTSSSGSARGDGGQCLRRRRGEPPADHYERLWQALSRSAEYQSGRDR